MSFDINSIGYEVEYKQNVKKINRFSNDILQDVMLGTYWANTMGKTNAPGVYQRYLEELESNMYRIISFRITYREMEDLLVDFGYEVGDIRNIFKKITGIDPVKIEYMRIEDVKNTPPNIPNFNLGWGKDKKGDGHFFIDRQNDLYIVFHQVDDMTRREIAYFAVYEEAKEYLTKLVEKPVFYDVYMGDIYMDLFKSYRTGPINKKAEEDHVAKEMQNKKLEEELKSKTPVERFQDSIKDKVDTYIADYIKEITRFISEKNLELKKYETTIRNIHYEKKENITPIITKIDNPNPKNVPGIIVSVVLQIRSLQLSEDKNKKFALALFFVGEDGKVSTTDSVKGEDDIIYGYSDEGFDKYFSSVK